MHLTSRFLCYIAVCTAGAVATTTAPVAPAEAAQEAPVRVPPATALKEWPADSTVSQSSLFRVEEVKPNHQQTGRIGKEPQQMHASVKTQTQPLTFTIPTEFVDDGTRLRLQQLSCSEFPLKKSPTSRHQTPFPDLQQVSLQLQEHNSKERRKDQRSQNTREPVDLQRPEHPTHRPLEGQPLRHRQTREQELEVSTYCLKPVDLERKRRGGDKRPRQEQRKALNRASARRKEQELVIPHKQARPSFLKKRVEGGCGAWAQQRLSRVKQPRPRAMSYQRPHMVPNSLRQPVELPKPEHHWESQRQYQSSATSVPDTPVETENLTDTRRALQHTVQRQVLDFDAPTGQQIHPEKQRQDGVDPEGPRVKPLGSTQDGTTDVRGQEQEVLWSAGNPNVQLPQQVNLSQVLIQNSSQLFFNYEQPQQRGSSKKKGEGGSTEAGEYNWQQHVRGQPGRSDGERQEREQEEQQKQLLQQQQVLLEELFALGRKVDEGQHQLKTYQDIRQQLQLLHLLQLQLVQQLTLLKDPGNQGRQHGQSKEQRQNSTQQHLQRQNVSLVRFDDPLHNTCATGNYPLIENFLQWSRVQKETSRLLALSSNLALSASAAEAPARIPSSTSNANPLNVKFNALSLRVDDFKEPEVGVFSSETDKSDSSPTSRTELALKELLSPARSETVTEASIRKIAQGGDVRADKLLPGHRNVIYQEDQQLQDAQRLRQPQQKAEQPLRIQTLEHVPRETQDKREVEEREHHSFRGEKQHAQDAAVQGVTAPLSVADVHRALLPLLHDPAERSAPGGWSQTAKAKDATLLVSPVSHLTLPSNRPGYTGQEEREQHAKHHHAPSGHVAKVDGRCHANGENSGHGSKKAEGAAAGAADTKCQTNRNIATAGSVEEDEVAGTHQAKREQREIQQPPGTKGSSVVATFEETPSPEVEHDKREHMTSTQEGVTRVDAGILPDNQPWGEYKPSKSSRTSEEMGTPPRMIGEAVDPGRGGRDVDTRQTSPISKSITLTQETRQDSEDQNVTSAPARGEEKRSEAGTQQHSTAADPTIPAGEHSDRELHKKAGAEASFEADATQNSDRTSHISLPKQRSASRAAQQWRHSNEMYQSKIHGLIIRQLQKQTQVYEEEVAALIRRITQQKRELEQRGRRLQRQRERLYGRFSLFEPEKRPGHQQAPANGDAPLQENEGEGLHVKKSSVEATTPLRQQVKRPLSRRRGTPAAEAGATYKQSSASSSRSLQMFNRSMFDVLPTQSALSLCKTSGQPCAAGTVCCEDLQCFTPVNNSYAAPSLDGRGTCQPGSTQAVPTSAFRLPIQMDPATPQRDEPRRGTTNQGSLFDVRGDTPNGETGGGPSGGNTGVGGLLNDTGADTPRDSALIHSPALGATEGVLGEETTMARNNGEARRRAGFAHQYNLPSNSRELTQEIIRSSGRVDLS